MTDPLPSIEARLEAATPGPWHIEHMQHSDGRSEIWVQPEDEHAWSFDCNTYQPSDIDRANADFIAHAPEDIRRLVEEVKRLRAEVSSLEDEREETVAYYERRIPYD